MQQKLERIVRYSLPLCVSFSTPLQHPTQMHFIVVSPFPSDNHNRMFLEKLLEVHTDAKTVQYVHVPYISHVSIYSERCAFPVFYPNVLHGPRGMIKDYNDLVNDTELHINKNFADFDPIYVTIQ